MSNVRCVLITPTDRHHVVLRRFALSTTSAERVACGCDSSRAVGEITAAETPTSGDDPAHFPHDDPRWPTACVSCGAPFVDGDLWQVGYDRIYVAPDGRECTVYGTVPGTAPFAGAMWDSPHLPRKGPDGRSLVLRLPDGRDWWIDGGSTNGNGWTRTGSIDALTVRPSILTQGTPERPGYHGFLTDGVLSPC